MWGPVHNLDDISRAVRNHYESFVYHYLFNPQRSDILTKFMTMDRAVKGKNKDPMLHDKQQREPGFLHKHLGWKYSVINVKVHGNEKDLFHMVRYTPFWDH